MEVRRLKDIWMKEEEFLTFTVNAMTFMDNTTVIAKDKYYLEILIKICHEFFEINEIKANIGKYELIKLIMIKRIWKQKVQKSKKLIIKKITIIQAFFLDMIIKEQILRRKVLQSSIMYVKSLLGKN